MTSLTALFPMLTWEFKMRALEQYYNHGFHELKTMFLEISEKLCMVRSKKPIARNLKLMMQSYVINTPESLVEDISRLLERPNTSLQSRKQVLDKLID